MFYTQEESKRLEKLGKLYSFFFFKFKDLLKDYFEKKERERGGFWKALLYKIEKNENESAKKTKELITENHWQKFSDCDIGTLLVIYAYYDDNNKRDAQSLAKTLSNFTRNGIFSHSNKIPIMADINTAISTLESFISRFEDEFKSSTEYLINELNDIKGNSVNPIISKTTVGTLAIMYIKDAVQKGKISGHEVQGLLDINYCRNHLKTHGYQFPILTEVIKDKGRYSAKNPILVNGKTYYISTQWYEDQRKYLEKWHKDHS